MRIKAKSDQD